MRYFLRLFHWTAVPGFYSYAALVAVLSALDSHRRYMAEERAAARLAVRASELEARLAQSRLEPRLPRADRGPAPPLPLSSSPAWRLACLLHLPICLRPGFFRRAASQVMARRNPCDIREDPWPALPWIGVAAGAPYFQTETGESWTPIGQNDAITWPDLEGLFRRRDLPGVERYLASLAASGVTCIRVMLEYAQGEHRYLERPPGTFWPVMVQLWDDLFALCARQGIRVLLTPFDTFWMWRRWKHHPYNQRNGGPCAVRKRFLTCRDTRAAIQRRLLFAAERWGGTGTLFAWDLWNELHPAYGGDDTGVFTELIEDLSETLRRRELELYGRSHPQTVSVFGPLLEQRPEVAETVFRHPRLDFASTHFYEEGTIDFPRNTVDAAVSVGRLVRVALAETPADRPFFDSEHGPIHTFKDHRRTLPEPFDDEYFRHIQWAHLASGGAGGGMRWPNRTPHSLTPGMRSAQKALAGFTGLIDWTRLRRRNLNQEIEVGEGWAGFACGDRDQAVAWVLRKDRLDRRGMLRRDAEPVTSVLVLPGLGEGRYRVTFWDTVAGSAAGCHELAAGAEGRLRLELPPLRTDIALAVRRL